MLLPIKYYDYYDKITHKRSLSPRGAFEILEMLDNYKNMIDAGLNSYEDKINFIKEYFEKGD